MMIEHDDWRLTNQMAYLHGVVLARELYRAPRQDCDHDHCEFCMAKFMSGDPEAEHAGYTTEDHYRWICGRCFEDFREMFGWTVKAS
jgi:hypothetical protein